MSTGCVCVFVYKLSLQYGTLPMPSRPKPLSSVEDCTLVDVCSVSEAACDCLNVPSSLLEYMPSVFCHSSYKFNFSSCSSSFVFCLCFTALTSYIKVLLRLGYDCFYSSAFLEFSWPESCAGKACYS